MSYRNRIVERLVVSAEELRRNPKNHRRHPDAQKAALRAILGDVGIVKSLTAFRHPEHGLTLIDGEARWQEGGEWPVEVVDLSEDEADLVLAALDRIGAQAEIDPAALVALLDGLPAQHRATASAAWSDGEIQRMLNQAGTEIIDASELWKGMPEFEQEDKTAFQSVVVHFKDRSAVDAFANLIDQKITDKTKYIHYPYSERAELGYYEDGD